MIKNFLSFLEANLSIPDLSKPSNQKVTDYGPLRGDVLLGKIKNREKVLTPDGEIEVDLIDNIDISTNGKYDPSKSSNLKQSKYRFKKSFIDNKTGKEYKLSDFVKTSEFGGGRGSSLGTVDTRIVELIQTCVFYYKQEYSLSKNLMIRIFDNEFTLEKISSYDDSITPDVIRKYKSYYLTFIKTANKFVSNNGILNRRKKYNFYQINSNSRFAKALLDSYRRSCKNTTGVLINFSKWTPSDVWAVNSSIEDWIVENLNSIDTMSALNGFIDLNFGIDRDRRRDLVGISLKKISSKKENIIIVINKETERPVFELDKVAISMNPYTKGVSFLLNRRSSKYPGKDTIESRSNSSGISNINLEIIGSSSRHGKCSLSQVNRFLKSLDMRTVPLASDLSKYDHDNLNDMIMDLYNEIFDSDLSKIKGKDNVTKPSFAASISKYQSLYLSKILLDEKILNSYKSDAIVNMVMYYALSIENEYFSCPKYARVVEYN